MLVFNSSWLCGVCVLSLGHLRFCDAYNAHFGEFLMPLYFMLWFRTIEVAGNIDCILAITGSVSFMFEENYCEAIVDKL